MINIVKEYLEKSIRCTLDMIMHPGPFDEKHMLLWIKKKISYQYIDLTKPVILFFDGKDTTKNHEIYNLADTSENNYISVLYHSAKAVMETRNIEAIIYAGADECSVIIPNPQQLIDAYGEAGQKEFITQIILLEMIKHIWKVYPKHILRGAMYQIDEEEIGEYIVYRREICNNIGLTWFCKENKLPSKIYHHKSSQQIEWTLAKEGKNVPQILTKGILGKTVVSKTF